MTILNLQERLYKNVVIVNGERISEHVFEYRGDEKHIGMWFIP